MKAKTITFFCGLFLIWSFASGQIITGAVTHPLDQFTNATFFKEYLRLREKAYESVKKFKIEQGKYSDEEIQLVKNAYNTSAENFNTVILNIKSDLLIKPKRKYMVEFPESYAKQVEADLKNAKEFYQTTYGKAMLNVTGGEIETESFIAMIPDIIKYSKLAFEVLKKIQAQVKSLKENALNSLLIDRYSFQTWDDI